MGTVEEDSYLSLRDKCKRHVGSVIKKMKPIVRSWYLNVALEFMNSRKLTNDEERILEEVSDYYLEKLDKLQ